MLAVVAAALVVLAGVVAYAAVLPSCAVAVVGGLTPRR